MGFYAHYQPIKTIINDTEFINKRIVHPEDIETEKQFYDFIAALHAKLKEDYNLINIRSDHEDPPYENIHGWSMGMINKYGIFAVDEFLDAKCVTNYAAIGSGSQFATGVLEVLYEHHPHLSIGIIAERATEIAMNNDLYCGGSVEMHTIKR